MSATVFVNKQGRPIKRSSCYHPNLSINKASKKNKASKNIATWAEDFLCSSDFCASKAYASCSGQEGNPGLVTVRCAHARGRPPFCTHRRKTRRMVPPSSTPHRHNRKRTEILELRTKSLRTRVTDLCVHA